MCYTPNAHSGARSAEFGLPVVVFTVARPFYIPTAISQIKGCCYHFAPYIKGKDTKVSSGARLKCTPLIALALHHSPSNPYSLRYGKQASRLSNSQFWEERGGENT
jgi:hypothetical protein